jgi:xanthine dehydrogenase molybdopterin-binding subunit B
MWPVNKPLAKIESIHQTSGEAQYCNDLPPYPGEVFCAFVSTEISNGKIESIDASKALALKGVIAFYSAKDVPGKNVCLSGNNKLMMINEDEILFAEKDILYAGQPVGVIVAETHNLANEAAALVKIKYSESLKKKPVITLKDALDTQDDTRFTVGGTVARQKRGKYIYSRQRRNLDLKCLFYDKY